MSGYLLVNVPVKPQGLLATVGWLKVADDTVDTWATGALFTSGNWKTNFGEGVPPLRSPRCLRGPISWKETVSGEEGCEWDEGDWVWYPLEGLPGLGLALPEEPAYKITPGGAERGGTFSSLIFIWLTCTMKRECWGEEQCYTLIQCNCNPDKLEAHWRMFKNDQAR